jgi:hypothetical protein
MSGITLKNLLLLYTSSVTPDGSAFSAAFTVPLADKTKISVNSATNKLIVNNVSSISFDGKFSSDNSEAISVEKTTVATIINFLVLNGAGYSLTTSTTKGVYSSDFQFTIPASLATEIINLFPES